MIVTTDDRAEWTVVHAPAHDFAEVDVVDGGESAEQFTARPGQCSCFDSVELVHRVGGELVEAVNVGPSMQDHQIVSNGRDFHSGHGTGPTRPLLSRTWPM